MSTRIRGETREAFRLRLHSFNFPLLAVSPYIYIYIYIYTYIHLSALISWTYIRGPRVFELEERELED